MAKVRVGLVGCGFVAELHMYAYKRVYGVDVQVTAVAARGDRVLDFAKKHQVHRTYRDFCRQRDRRRRHLHPTRLAREHDCRRRPSGKARHLREAVHRIFRTK